MMNRPPIPTSAFRQPSPPRRRRTDGSNSNKLSKTTVKVTNIEFLPDELLFDILARLPSEFDHDISRLVCSKWRRIIDSVYALSNRQIQRTTYGLLMSSQLHFTRRRHSIYATATQGRVETSELSYGGRRTTIIGCCNGLALELDGETLVYSLHVTNPLTKKSFLLPSFSVERTHVFHDGCGIGYSAASMKYKVTLPYKHVEDDHKLICLAILTVGVNKSWRRIELPDFLGDRRQLLRCSPLTSEGFLHWGRRGDCLTLNVETERFTTSIVQNIPRQPQYTGYSYYYYYFYYLSTGRYLSLLVGRAREFCWDVWEMQCGGGGEWRKLKYKIDLEAQKEKLQQFAPANHSIMSLIPVGWVKYPKILVFGIAGTGLNWRHCIFYNLETHEIKTIELNYNDGKRGGGYKAFVHRNNLVHLV